MERINLDETWKLCLSMWEWIVEKRKEDGTLSVILLKEKWLQKHSFKKGSVTNDCFFCEYVVKRRTCVEVFCPDCPGAKVEPTFSCLDDNCYYDDKPIAFYKKLLVLNKIRLAKKRRIK